MYQIRTQLIDLVSYIGTKATTSVYKYEHGTDTWTAVGNVTQPRRQGHVVTKVDRNLVIPFCQ